jgi:2,4-dienoyl-CoA reductase-like NADH-dependent reductase (Old Yellow Enzyme family)
MGIASLFEPFTCRSLVLKNRIVFPSVARWASPGGNPAALGAFYEQRARGGASLIMTEGVAINRPASYNDPRSPHFFGPALESWSAIVRGIHDAGSTIIPQLWHAGSVAKKASEWQAPGEPESPSGLVSAQQARGRAMTETDIEGVLSAYLHAARAATELNMDGVEVHAGHGYLLDQFFWEQTNRRSDEWGGETLAERSRFPLAVVRAVRAEIGNALPLFLRISNWKSAALDARMFATPSELEAWLVPFAEAGVDLFSVSSLRYDEPVFPGSALTFAGWVKKVTGVPVMAAGGIGMSGTMIDNLAGTTGLPQDVDDVARRISDGEIDLIGVGRAMVSNPTWPERIAKVGSPSLAPCTQADLVPSNP